MPSSQMERFINELLSGWFVAREVRWLRTYGETSVGQEYALVVTKGLWYKIRIIFRTIPRTWPSECSCYEMHNTQHTSLEGVKEMIAFLRELFGSLSTEYHRLINTEATKMRAYIRAAEKEWVNDPDCTHDQYVDKVNEFQEYIDKNCLSKSEAAFREAGNFKTYTVPSDWARNPDRYLQPGDVLLRNLKDYFRHSAIYMGNSKVIHISGEPHPGGGKFGKNSHLAARRGVLIGSEAECGFVESANDWIQVVIFNVAARPGREIVACAEKLANAVSEAKALEWRPGDYKLLTNNCQQFATECALGARRLLEVTSAGLGRLGEVGDGVLAFGVLLNQMPS